MLPRSGNSFTPTAIGAVISVFALVFLAAATGSGQTPTPEASPSPTAAASPSETPTPTPSPTPTPRTVNVKASVQQYYFRDVPMAKTIQGKYFALKLVFAVLGDFTFFHQNDVSKSQVGPQASMFDLRAARIVAVGIIKFKKPWTYMVGGDINELRQQGDRVFDPLDAHVSIPLWKQARVTIGKQKESFIYELVCDSANLPQQERLLNPFFLTRNVGIKYSDNFFGLRTSFSVGYFNNFLSNGLSFKKSGTEVSGRFTGIPFASKGFNHFLHLGVSYRYQGADDGKMRFKGRPESNITDYFVDTGNFAAKYANQLGLEALYNKGRFSSLAEFTSASVKAPQYGNPTFYGMYVTNSYVITGEYRPYDPIVGYARRIIPDRRWGAFELVNRIGYVDLDDTFIKGGRLTKLDFGLNWWASRQWKMGVMYGIASLRRFDTRGITQAVHFRLQWIYI